MGLIKTLIIIICILWLIKVIMRLVLPLLFQSMVRKAQNHAHQHSQQQKHYPRPDGKITIDYIPPSAKDKGSSGGEFVDYEEIK